MAIELSDRDHSDTLLAAVIETAVDGIIIIDERGTVHLYNAACEALFGYRGDEVIGENIKMLMPSDYRDEHDGYLENYITTGEARVIGIGREVAGRRKDGSEFPMWLSVGEASHQDQRCFVGIVHDITEQKSTEEQLRLAKEDAEAATRAKSDFLAVMSHEIRGPLHNIMATNNLLMHTALEERQLGYAQAMNRSGGCLLELVDRIFYLSKIEMGLVGAHEMRCKIDEILKSVEFTHRPKIDEKGLEFFTHISRDVPAVLLCDADRIREVLSNLIDNALRFTEQGYIALKVAVATAEEPQSADTVMLRFEVKDTGAGIEPELQARLFHHFEQDDSSLTRKQGSFGLGLAICRQLVRLLGGEISVESEPGKGCMFWFTVTCRQAHDRSFAAQREQREDVTPLPAGVDVGQPSPKSEL